MLLASYGRVSTHQCLLDEECVALHAEEASPVYLLARLARQLYYGVLLCLTKSLMATGEEYFVKLWTYTVLFV